MRSCSTAHPSSPPTSSTRSRRASAIRSSMWRPTVSVLDADKVRAHGVEVLDPSALGADELIARGVTRTALSVELALRACRTVGVDRGVVPPDFPVAVADHLRANGIELVVDAEVFVARRRAKTPAQLAGIRRAQQAAD